jgi:hypothetical protein
MMEDNGLVDFIQNINIEVSIHRTRPVKENPESLSDHDAYYDTMDI